jgi:acetyl esterase/lipase
MLKTMTNSGKGCALLLAGLLTTTTLRAQTKPDYVIPDSIAVDEVPYTGAGAGAKTLLIAYPKNRSVKRPAVIHLHGGGFRQGAAEGKTAVLFAKAGFIGISINYRLSGEAIFPAAVHDAKTAVRWARAQAARYGIDPDRIGAFGGSAGGHLALLLGLSEGDAYLEGDGPYREFSSRVRAVVDNYGPTDFMKLNDMPGDIDHNAPQSPESAFIGGAIQENPEPVRRANPLMYIDPTDPPTLVLHGENDRSVPIQQSELLVAALARAGVVHQFVRVKNAGHGFRPKPDPQAVLAPTRPEIEAMWMEWFKKHL